MKSKFAICVCLRGGRGAGEEERNVSRVHEAKSPADQSNIVGSGPDSDTEHCHLPLKLTVEEWALLL